MLTEGIYIDKIWRPVQDSDLQLHLYRKSHDLEERSDRTKSSEEAVCCSQLSEWTQRVYSQSVFLYQLYPETTGRLYELYPETTGRLYRLYSKTTGRLYQLYPETTGRLYVFYSSGTFSSRSETLFSSLLSLLLTLQTNTFIITAGRPRVTSTAQYWKETNTF